jgi:hypothetical protein
MSICGLLLKLYIPRRSTMRKRMGICYERRGVFVSEQNARMDLFSSDADSILDLLEQLHVNCRMKWAERYDMNEIYLYEVLLPASLVDGKEVFNFHGVSLTTGFSMAKRLKQTA